MEIIVFMGPQIYRRLKSGTAEAIKAGSRYLTPTTLARINDCAGRYGEDSWIVRLNLRGGCSSKEDIRRDFSGPARELSE